MCVRRGVYIQVFFEKLMRMMLMGTRRTLRTTLFDWERKSGVVRLNYIFHLRKTAIDQYIPIWRNKKDIVSKTESSSLSVLVLSGLLSCVKSRFYLLSFRFVSCSAKEKNFECLHTTHNEREKEWSLWDLYRDTIY